MKRWIPILALLVLLPMSAWAESYTTSTCCLVVDYTATNGFVWMSDGTDLSDLAAGTTNTRIIVTDSAGKIAKGKAGFAGSGTTTVGAEMSPDPDFSIGAAAWDVVDANWTLGGGDADSNGGSGFLERSNGFAVGTFSASYFAQLDVTVRNSGKVTLPYNGGATSRLYAEAVGHFVKTFCHVDSPTGDDKMLMYSSLFNGSIDNNSLKRILTPGATGLYVVWDSVESGFNYNDTSGYSIKLRTGGGEGPRSRINRRMR